MAATAEARRLSEAHRVGQARLGAQTVALVLATWRVLNPEDFQGTFADWLRVIVPLVQAQREKSATLAANFVRTYRSLELGLTDRNFEPVVADAVDVPKLTTSLLVTGPAVARAALARGVNIDDAVEAAQVTSSGAAMRHVLNGGRETIVGTVDADDRALGWARTTSGSPCSFCAMLVGRGPVYRSEDSGGFQAHDHCSCGVEPVYRSDAPWTAQARHYRDLWEETTAGLGGDDARNAFRLALSQA